MTATKAEIYAAKTLRQLQDLERIHGYAFGWANKVHKARHDRSNRSRKSGGAVVQKEQNSNAQNERNGSTRLARPAYLYSHYANVD